MSSVYAVTQFVVHVTAAPAHEETLYQGAMRDSAEAVVIQCPSLFTAAAPARGSIPNTLYDHLQLHSRGPG